MEAYTWMQKAVKTEGRFKMQQRLQYRETPIR